MWYMGLRDKATILVSKYTTVSKQASDIAVSVECLLANHDFTFTIMVSVFIFSIIWKKEIIRCDTNSCTWLSLDKLTKDKLNSTACFDAGFDDLTTQIIYLTETYSKYHSKSLHRHLAFPESFINPCSIWCVTIKCE